MPKIGEIRLGREIGYANAGSRFIYAACIGCGKTRWVKFLHNKPASPRCYACANKKSGQEYKRLGVANPTWKGGRLRHQGYIQVRVYSDDPYYPMADKNGYVLEHRLIMAKKLGRCLLPSEHIHHKDGIRDHNADDNLELTNCFTHRLSYTKGYQQGYQDALRVKAL